MILMPETALYFSNIGCMYYLIFLIFLVTEGRKHLQVLDIQLEKKLKFMHAIYSLIPLLSETQGRGNGFGCFDLDP